LDGAGKSTHAEHLRRALEALGYDVSVQWTKIARDQWLKRTVAPIRSLVNVLLRSRHSALVTATSRSSSRDPEGETRNYPDGTPPPPDPAKLLRQRSRLLTSGWTFALAFANATTHRREVRRRGTRVVICDRYVLDSMAHLRYRYGLDRTFRWQGALVRVLSPRASAAFFLDVSPATARARKPEQYTTSDLEILRECYLDAASRLTVEVIDGEQPLEDVAASIARHAWLRLRGR
jgi:thymidylate kinase